MMAPGKTVHPNPWNLWTCYLKWQNWQQMWPQNLRWGDYPRSNCLSSQKQECPFWLGTEWEDKVWELSLLTVKTGKQQVPGQAMQQSLKAGNGRELLQSLSASKKEHNFWRHLHLDWWDTCGTPLWNCQSMLYSKPECRKLTNQSYYELTVLYFKLLSCNLKKKNLPIEKIYYSESQKSCLQIK